MTTPPPSTPRVLLLLSSPLSADPVGVDNAQRKLTDALRGLDAPAEFHSMVAEADAVSALMAQGNRARFDVLHYYGHGYKPEGVPAGALIFEDRTGGVRGLDSFRLRAVLNPSNHSDPEFSLAILTACHSESVAEAVYSLGVPHIVAVDADESVYVIAAVAFFRRFYQALLTGATVQAAFDAGRNAVLTDEALDRLGTGVALREAGKFKLLPDGADHDLRLPGADGGAGAAQVTPLPALTQPPFNQRPASFVGRERDLQAVLQTLDTQRALQILGVSGVGKTELAKEVAHWLAARRRVDAGRTWFVPLLNVRTAREARTAIAIAAGIAAQSLPEEDAAADAALAAALTPGSLLVLDEAENVRSSGGLAFRRLLEALIAAPARPLVIVTSQTEIGSAHLPRHALHRLTPYHARLLFARAANVTDGEWRGFDQAYLDKVLAYVDRVPRAVELVARQWRHSHSHSFGPLLADLARLQDEIMHDPDYPEEIKSVTVGVRLAYERLAGYSPAAAALYPLLALFPGGLPEAGIEPIFGQDGPRLLRQIENELLAERSWPDMVYLPAPFRFFAERHLDGGEAVARAQIGEAALRFYFSFDEEPHRGWINTLDSTAARAGEAMGSVIRHFVAELPSIESWLDWAFDAEPCQDNKARASRLVARLQNFYVVTGLQRYQETRLLRALASARQCQDASAEADVLRALGDLTMRSDNRTEARRHFETALAIYRAIDDRLGEANVLKAQGDLAKFEAKLAEARQRYEAALAIYSAIGAQLGEANVLQALGELAQRYSNLAEARRFYQAALQIYRDIGAQLGEANVLRALGDLSLRENDLAEAQRYLTETLALFNTIGARLGSANALHALGNLALRRHELVEARRHYEGALTLFEVIGERLGQAHIYRALGDLSLREADVSETRRRYTASLAIYEAINDRLGKANTLQALGDLASNENNLQLASDCYDEALVIYEAIDDGQGKANVLQGMGDLALQTNDLAKARRCYDEALAIHHSIGDRNGEANVKEGLSKLLFLEGRPDEAQKLITRSIVIFSQIGDRLSAAGAYTSLGRGTDDPAAFEQAIAIYSQINSVNGVASATFYYGLSQSKQGNLERARTLLVTARDIWTRIGLPQYAQYAQQAIDNL